MMYVCVCVLCSRSRGGQFGGFLGFELWSVVRMGEYGDRIEMRNGNFEF